MFSSQYRLDNGTTRPFFVGMCCQVVTFASDDKNSDDTLSVNHYVSTKEERNLATGTTQRKEEFNIICKKVAYCWTNIIGPDQTPRVMRNQGL